jgi:hypothetical protein
LTGYEIFVLKTASEFLNFTYDISNPADLEWGKVTNQTWSGMVGDIVRGQVDFGLGALVTGSRLRVVEVSVITEMDKMVFASAKPRPYFDRYTLAHPFAVEVWLCYILSTFVMAVLMAVLVKQEHLFIGQSAIGKSSWFVFGSTLSQEIKLVQNHRLNSTR